MPFPQNMVYVRHDFTWTPSEEIQSFGYWGVVEQEGVAVFQDWDQITQAIANRARDAWLPIPTARYSFPVKAQRVVAYHYRQDHKEVLDRAEAPFVDANAWKGSSTNVMPPENSVVLSLYGYEPSSYVPQRDSKRGRIYLPTPAAGRVGIDGMLAQSDQESTLSEMQSFFDGVEGKLDLGDLPLLDDTHFRTHISSVTKQYATRVSHLRVGRVVDTQRRRRNQLGENYVSGPLSA